MPLDDTILGQGVYTPQEAARLVGTNSQQVLRWTRGSGAREPLLHAYYQFLDEEVTEISFLDLIEVRVIAAMRRNGISLQSIRFAVSFAKEELGIERPLASQKFKTEGAEILMEAVEGDGDYVSLSKKQPGQMVFRRIVEQSLNDLEYDDEIVARWRPRKSIVIDPARHFGDPILDQYGISTKTLRDELAVFQDITYLSKIYEIPASLIHAAVAYENSLDKAYGKGSL